MNYTELVTAVTDYCENTFPTEDMNTFIQQAEQRIYNTVQLAYLRKNVTGGLSANSQYLACPTDFLSAYSMAIFPTSGGDDYIYLLDKDVNFIRQAYPSPTATGVPKYYALFGPAVNSGDMTTNMAFIIGPTPNVNYNVELNYYFYPESIVTANETWLGEHFSSVLLYGTMCEALTYMKGDPEMSATYNDRYVQALALLKNLADGKQRQDTYRNGQLKVPVV
jgi:hypothetical protein